MIARLLPLSISAAVLIAATGPASAEAPSPSRPVPPAWTEGAAVPTAAEIDDRWWLAFGDPILSDLVARAGAADDAELARARLTEARAALRRSRAALAPNLGAALSGRSERPGDDPDRSDSASAVLDASWELDLFGQNRTRARAAGANAEAVEAEVAAARVAARASAARLYVTYRDAQAQEAAALRTVEALEGLLRLAEARQRAGLVGALDVEAARATLAQARARPIGAREAAATARLGLEALLGLSPGALAPTLAQARPAPGATPQALLAPASVLANRPDLIAAEARLRAAGFDADAARADFWPRLSIGAVFGAQSVDPVSPFSGSGALWRLTAGLTAPLFSFGRLEAARDAADARAEQAAIAYRRAATRALADVETALVAGASAESRRAAQAEALDAAVRRAGLARARYAAGLSPLLDVLVAEQGVYQAEADLARARADAALAYASLSSALGLGGRE